MQFDRLVRILGILLMLAPLVISPPEGMSNAAWHATGLAVTMALWWLTEAIPLAATALLPILVAPLFGISGLSQVAAAYVDPLIVLFLGGFLLARAIVKSGLHTRIAVTLIEFAGNAPRKLLAAVMAATAFLSLWISNTASAMVLAPIASAIAAAHPNHRGFGTALMLGVAFAATIGGMGSLIGTPPNAIFAAHVRETYGANVGFAEWALVGLPVASLMLVVAWGFLSGVSPGVGSRPLELDRVADIGAMGPEERRVALVAGLTALGWISRPLLEWLFPALPVSDAGIAMTAALMLFVLPDGGGGRLLDLKTAIKLRWDVLILFGGGLALAGILQDTGIAASIGGLAASFAHWPEFIVLLGFAALIVYVGELASNTAMAAIFLPIAGAAAVTLNTDPVAFLFPIALAASIGFMLPVATPPNAIVFADPVVTRSKMLRAGAPLDVIGLVVAVGTGYVLAPLVFG